MGDNRHTNSVEQPEPPTADEVVEQLEASRRAREQAEVVNERAEQTASEMSRLLRKIASAMDRNPQSWDSLFEGGRRS